ncbi:MAG: carbohydrate kinase family protein [Pseudomonadota bacterium]
MSFFHDFCRVHSIDLNANRPNVVGIGQPVVDTGINIDSEFVWEAVQPCRVTRHVGGSSLNTLRTLKYLGCSASFVSAIGQDPEAHMVAKCLREEGIDTTMLRSMPEFACNQAYIISSSTRFEKTIFLHRQSVDFGLEERDVDDIRKADVIHFNGYFNDFFTSALKHIDRDKTRISINCGLGPQSNDAFNAMKTANTVVASRDFCAKYSSNGADECASHFFASSEFAELFVVTSGAKGGQYFLKSGETCTFEANSAVVKNTTGAGDAFHAGVLFGQLYSLDPSEYFSLASWLGSRCCETDAPVFFL